MTNDILTKISEDLVAISANRTLVAGRFTAEAAHKPEVVHSLRSLTDVFHHYGPLINVELEDTDGRVQAETFKFLAIEDFSLEGITGQNAFFKKTAQARDSYLKAAKQLKLDGQLKNVLVHQEKRKAFLSVVLAMIQDLKNSK